MFSTPDIKCTEANGHLSTFLTRVLCLSERVLGRVVSVGGADQLPFTFPLAVLPPLVPCFQAQPWAASSLSSIDILERIFFSGEKVGRQTTTWQARTDEHDRIRLAIATASPQDREGLMNVVDVYRESDHQKGPKARAMEVMFTEQCLDSIGVVDSTKALARVALGVVKGLRSFYRLGNLHRYVFPGNIVVSQDGQGVFIDYDLSIFMDTPSRGKTGRLAWVGTFPFKVRVMANKYQRKRILHQPWHDIESLLYVILFIVVSQPQGPRVGTPGTESTEARHQRSRKLQFIVENGKWELFEDPSELTKMLSSCQESWVGNKELGSIPPRWELGESPHDRLIKDLERFIDSLA
ncbi:BQ2448_7824 [Microbotryum intermedium]|uniref:BQ2448_7824 protein n=1 Tax=Microbotryum intermedium TaxID=269621 RepID=A0A238FNN9_9BASI|nr:BQ2448_7824 [Microbotryum intermedium]